jgi:16S rRNA (cytidine1402-2'-O)-methyltransferase
MTTSKDDHAEERGPGGVLYVVSTPIGNLEDVTLRALTVLKSVDLIAAENVNHTRVLCSHYGIRTRLTAFNQHNQKARAPELLGKLKSGRDIALVTDAGTPGISDPGVFLIGRAAQEHIRITPIPGPSAATAALSVAGMPTDRFVFLGFLSNKAGRRARQLRELENEPRTMVFFEAPHRIRAMLKDMRDILGDRHAVMVREMTKVYEEVKRGRISEILEQLAPELVRGEFTLVVEGNREGNAPEGLGEEVVDKIDRYLSEEALSVRDIAEKVSTEEAVPYRAVYRACLERKGAMEDQVQGVERAGHDFEQMEQIRKFRISNNLGLHARAAAKIVELAGRHRARLYLKKDAQEVDGSSILSILTLSCPKGTEIEARAVGEDSERLMEELRALFEGKFGESR